MPRKTGYSMYTDNLQRTYVILVLLATSIGLVNPLLFAEPESKLPACCRHDGKHHCSMMASKSLESSGPVIKAKASRCSLYPSNVAAPAVLKFLSLPPQHIEVPGLAASSSPSPQEDERWSGVHLSGETGRGPPSYSL